MFSWRRSHFVQITIIIKIIKFPMDNVLRSNFRSIIVQNPTMLSQKSEALQYTCTKIFTWYVVGGTRNANTSNRYSGVDISIKKLYFSCSPICLSELVAKVAGDGSTATGSTLASVL